MVIKELEYIEYKIHNHDYPKEWREGQALFNLAEDNPYLKPYVDLIRGTKYDCFYDDSKITDFVTKIIDLSK